MSDQSNVALPLPDRQPLVTALFELVARRRDERLRFDLTEDHFAGLEQLFRFLDDTSAQFEHHASLARVVVLVKRVRADFETALFEYLAGLDQATFNSMRDVMEVEYLLREFVYDPNQIEEWHNIPQDERWRVFGPGQLRRRHGDRLGVRPSDLLDSAEYSAHSGMIHVDPLENLIVKRGVSHSEHPELGAAFALADLLHHARDITVAFYEIAFRANPPLVLSVNPQTDLPQLRSAFELTMSRYRNAMLILGLAKVVADYRSNAGDATGAP